jgi:hypothetical protein
VNARFEGPVLQDVQKIESPDAIDLDFTPQCFVVFDSYYIVNLSWEEATHNSDGTVSLRGAVISNKDLESLHKIQDNDFILVNTEKHREEVHAFNFVYESQVIKHDKTPYKYEKL